MKKIGSGLQFKIYDLENGRVLKKSKKSFQMYALNILWEPYLIFVPWILRRRITNAKKDRDEAVEYFSSKNFDKEIVANLDINSKGIFQDKVIPVREILRESETEGKRLVDSYCNLIKKMWGQGFAEKVYKFVENYGVNSNGEVVLIDFAELRFTKNLIKQDILRERWRHVFSDKRKIRGELKKYYDQKMTKLLTIQNLNNYWKNEKNI